MGVPKQLAKLGGLTLVDRAVGAALESGAAEVVVVLGAGADQVREALAGASVRIVVNEAWEDGLGSSIGLGVQALSLGLEAVILTLADQPFVPAAHLRQMAETPGSIVATRWDEASGPPCLFEKVHFAELTALSGDQGAKALIRQHGATYLPLQDAQIDIDTPADLASAEGRLSGGQAP
jgi:molybdenum cofactor cytidylyltransferase